MKDINKEDWQAVSDLSRIAVETLASEELDDFDLTFEEFQKNPDSFKSAKAGESDMGAGFLADPILTPIIIAVLKELVVFIVKSVKEQIEPQTSEFIGKLVKHKLNVWLEEIVRADNKKAKEKENSESAKMLAKAEEVARQYGLPKEQAKDISLKIIQLIASNSNTTADAVK